MGQDLVQGLKEGGEMTPTVPLEAATACDVVLLPVSWTIPQRQPGTHIHVKGGIIVVVKEEARVTSGENVVDQSDVWKGRCLEGRRDEETKLPALFPNTQGICAFTVLGLELVILRSARLVIPVTVPPQRRMCPGFGSLTSAWHSCSLSCVPEVKGQS